MRRTLRLWTLLGVLIPLGLTNRAEAQCATASLLFNSSEASGDWRSHANLAVPTGSTTYISSSGYSSGAVVQGGTTVLNTTVQQLNGVTTLFWRNIYPGTVAFADRNSKVTFNFSRPVSGLTIRVQDIDKGPTFTDEVVFSGRNGSTVVLPTLSRSNVNNTNGNAPTLNQTTATATGTADVANTTDGTVTATYGSPVTSITLTYSNAYNGSPGDQAIGIEQISWCRQAPVANDVTNAVALASSAAQTSISALSATSDGGSITSYRVTRLPAANEGVLYYNAPVFLNPNRYIELTTGTVLAPDKAATLRFDPAPTFSGGNVTFAYTATDDGSIPSNPGTFTIPIQAVAVTGGSCGGSYLDGNAHSGLTAEYYNGYFADNMGFFAGATPALRRYDALLDFTTNAGWGSLVTGGAGTGTDANADSYSARYRGSMYVQDEGNYTFFLNSDDASYLWLDAAALATTPTVATATIDNGGGHSARERSATVFLGKGLHHLLLFYGESTTDNVLTLSYQGPSGSGIARQVVPNSALCAGPGNLPPVASNVSGTLPPLGYTLTPALSGTDADGSVGSFRIASLPANGTLALNGTPVAIDQVITAANAGSLTFTPTTAGYTGTSSFTYHAIDNLDMRSTTAATYTITVTNRAPVVVNDSRDVPLNTTVSGNVVLNDYDQEQNTFTVTLGAAPAHGTLTLNPNGTYSYTPANGYTGPDSFTYSACDNATPAACSGLATVNLRVFSTNTACTSATGSNLLQNAAFSSGNTGFSTNYRYVASGYVAGNGASGLYPEGTYAVGPNANTFHPNFQGTGHTGGTGDNFLMVNGAASIRTLYSQTVTVVPGRYYSFSAWFNNLLPPGSNSGVPELGFVINGESVSGTITLNESPDQWVQFSDVWYSGTSTTATFEIRNVSTALGGNDLAVDDVYFGTCNLAPTAVADAATLLSGSSVTIDVLANDIDPENALNAGTIDLNPNQGGQQLSFSTPGGTFSVSGGKVVFTPTSGFVGTATASYTVQDAAGAATNQANLAVTVPPTTADLSVALTSSAGASVTAGQAVTFTQLTTNNGPAAASGVAPTLQLPAGLTGPGPNGALTFSSGGSYDVATGLVTFPTTSLASGGSVSNSVTFLAPGSGPITAAANATATTADATTSNNTASMTLGVATGFDLTTAISGPGAVGVGTALNYVVVTRNAGPSAATGVTQTVSLPGNLTGLFLSNNGSYAYSAGTNTTVVTFPSLGMLAGGQTATNTITLPAPATATTLVATASVATSSNGETTTSNNAATTSTTVGATSGAAANMLVRVAATSGGAAVSSAEPGAPLTLSLTGTNAGPGTANSVVGTLTLPAGLNPASLTISDGGSYNASTGVVTWTTASLPVGTTYTTTVQLTAPAAGPLLVSAGITSTSADPVVSDNVASTLVTISPTADVATLVTGPTSVTAGQRVSYTVTTTNKGGSTATNVQQMLRLPPAVANLSYTSNLPAGTTGALDVQPNQTLLTYPVIAALAPGQSVTNTVTFDAPAAAYAALAYVTSGTADHVTSNNTSSVAATTTRASDVVTTVAGPATVVSGTPVVFSVRTVNNGTAPAAGETTTVQLPTDLGNVVVRDETGAIVSNAYNAATGIVTFAARAEVAVGYPGAVTRTISFVAPDVAAINATAVATTSAATNDLNRANNVSTAAVSVLRPTMSAVDMGVTLTSNVGTQTAGQPVTFTLTTTNHSATNAAGNVQPQVVLPAGLSGVSVSDGGSYDAATGLVTFPTLTMLAAAGSQVGTITVTVPGTGTLTVLASVGSANSDGMPANNTVLTSVGITPLSNVRTVVRSQGTALTSTVLAGQPVTYLVRALNDGPSPAQNVGLTVQLPAGLDPATVSISGGGSYVAATGVVTFPTVAALPASQEASLAYTITFPAPTTTFMVSGTTTTSTAQSSTADDTQTFTTSLRNQAPVANTLQNQLTAPDGNTAATPLALSPLSARDADGTISSYVITSLPDAATQGTLFYSADGVTYNPVALTGGRFALPAANAGNLRFRPVSSFVGNAFFSFLAVDNASAESAAALYAIPVGQDNAAVYTAAPAKGGSASNYVNGDLISSAFDANGGRYSSATVVADNGVRSASTDANGLSTLSGLGLTLNPTTGAITVLNRNLLRGGSYSVSVTTVDEYGGTTTQPVSFTIGFGPLPVTLTAFQAQTQQQNTLLTWTTAQEKNNDHFDVERSLDGTRFEKVGEVAGHGNSTTTHDYRFMDEGAARLGRTLYYRLRQVDFDGTATLSEVRAVRFAQAATVALSVFPNPATDLVRLSLTGAAGPVQATLLSTTGQQLRQVRFDATQTATLDLQSLPAGTYLLRLQAADGQTYTQRLVKH